MSLVARDLTARYGAATVLHDVNCSAVPGSFTALLGPNGSGKSTLLRCLAGALIPAAGAVLLDDVPLERVLPSRRAARIAHVPQHSPTGFAFTVGELVGIGAGAGHCSGNAAGAAAAAAARAITAMDLDPFVDRSLLTLSGGERQRATVARALAQNTPYLLLDEPTAHLDLRHQAGVLDLLRRKAQEDGRSVLAVLHDLNLAATYADRLVLISDGCVAASGTPDEVLTQATIELVYQTFVHVDVHPITKRPWILAKPRQADGLASQI